MYLSMRSIPGKDFCNKAIVTTHARLARTKAAHLSSPGFFLRGEEDTIRTAMPLHYLAEISGYAEQDLPILLAPVVHNVALLMVRDRHGNEVVPVADDVADDDQIRRFFEGLNSDHCLPRWWRKRPDPAGTSSPAGTNSQRSGAISRDVCCKASSSEISSERRGIRSSQMSDRTGSWA